MLFNSPIFLFAFLPIVLIGYFVLPQKIRNLILLTVSLIFYWWGEPVFIRMIIVMIIANYFSAISISIASKSKRKAKFFLLVGVGTNLLFLFYYKYHNFFFENLFYIFPRLKFNLAELLLPLAISFFTFHAISYLVDVYKKKIPPQTNLLQLSLYFLLFPHLLAGPIVRYADISDQLEGRKITLDNFSYGIVRFIIGISKKVLIADTLAFTVDEIFATPPAHLMPISAWYGMLGYTLQIYFDFSGYSDMAIGLALMFGFKLPENFNYPYSSTSLTEFWRRWHITLSNWFRDYVYIPLGGNRRSPFRNYLNLWIVFLLVGLWHGAGWSFISWGIYQGLFLVLERMTFLRNTIEKLPIFSITKHIYLILIVMIGWVFFRSTTVTYALSFINRLLQVFDSSAYANAYHPLMYFVRSDVLLAIILGSILCFPITSQVNKIYCRFCSTTHILGLKTVVKVTFLFFLLFIFILSMIAVSVQTYNPFIYFRF